MKQAIFYIKFSRLANSDIKNTIYPLVDIKNTIYPLVFFYHKKGMFVEEESLIMVASFVSAHISTNLPTNNACQEINTSILKGRYTHKTTTPLFLQWKLHL